MPQESLTDLNALSRRALKQGVDRMKHGCRDTLDRLIDVIAVRVCQKGIHRIVAERIVLWNQSRSAELMGAQGYARSGTGFSLKLCYRRQRNPGTVLSGKEKLNDFSLALFVPPNVNSQCLDC